MKSAFTMYGLLMLIVLAGAYYAFTFTSNQEDTMGNLTLTSSVFEHNGAIPEKYTCDGDNVNPPLEISGVPEGAEALVLLMDDPDVPTALRPDGNFDHWVLYNVLPNTTTIAEGTAPGEQGLNGRDQAAYTGPCPPTEYEPTEHRYFFKLYALSGELAFDTTPTKAEVEQAIEGKILEQTELVGRYDRAK